MPGNIGVSYGNTVYKTIPVSSVYYSGKSRPANNEKIFANTYYKFGEISYLSVNLDANPEGTYGEYMFEFTAAGELIVVRIIGTSNLKWVRTPAFRVGFRYQVSILNDIALWTEVSAT